ncbi:MAG: exosortase X [Flavobacteriales bacterium]
MKKILENPAYAFVIKFAALFLLWYVVYNLWLSTDTAIDLWVVKQTIGSSKFLLETFGYNVYTEGRVIGANNSSGLFVGDNCNALVLIALFVGFILAYPGTIKRKVVYIMVGTFSIFLLNVLRISALCAIDTYSRAWTEFNHSYTFNFLVYGYIFLLWYLWAERFSGVKIFAPKPENSNDEQNT